MILCTAVGDLAGDEALRKIEALASEIQDRRMVVAASAGGRLEDLVTTLGVQSDRRYVPVNKGGACFEYTRSAQFKVGPGAAAVSLCWSERIDIERSSIVGAICLSHALKAALSAAEKCCHSLGHTASSQFLRQETSHAMAPCMQRTGHLLMCHTATPLLHLR